MQNRKQLDLTDRELYQIALALETHINSRDFYISKNNAIVLRNVFKKVIENGMTRKNPKDILHPIVEFLDE